MPFPGAVFTSSAAGDIGGGRPYTAFDQSAVLIGTQQPGGTNPLPPILGLGLIQSTQPVTNVVTTTPAVIARSNFLYIPQTTAGIATSSFAAAESAPPLSGLGAALIWDAGNRRLGIYSTASGTGTWFFSNTGITTSAGSGGFTSS